MNLVDRFSDWRYRHFDPVTRARAAHDRSCNYAGHMCVCGKHQQGSRVIIAVDRQSLRRRYVKFCGADGCRRAIKQTSAAGERTLADWEREHPVPPVTLDPLLKPQYPSRARQALRHFVESGLDAATLDGLDAGTLNGAVGVLGLSDVYAEQRSGSVALRRARARK